MILLTLYFILIVFLSIYSYALVDPNITFFNHPLWTGFRNVMVYFGYYQRQNSWLVYLSIILLLFIFNCIFVIKYKKLIMNPLKIAFIIGIILVFSYPFLSHDFFSYIYFARIFTMYHRNPYTYIAGDFYLDPWLRFTQWTGTNYPYGPVALILTIIPSFLGLAKFAPTFFLFKITSVSFYLLSVRFLEKLNKKWAIMFASSPLIIIEGLINGHNDLISVSLVIIGIYYLFKNKKIPSTLFILLSVGIKYLTFPFMIVLAKLKSNKLLLLSILSVLIFWIIKSEIQPWYFIILFGLLPFYEDLLFNFNIFFFGLLMSYYPYVRFGAWGKVLYWTTDQKVIYKHNVIIIFFMINLAYLLINHFWFRRKFFIK